jgi:hypothetical protein
MAAHAARAGTSPSPFAPHSGRQRSDIPATVADRVEARPLRVAIAPRIAVARVTDETNWN